MNINTIVSQLLTNFMVTIWHTSKYSSCQSFPMQHTWTFLATNMKSLEVFYLKCLQQILNIWWYQHVTNVDILFILWSFLSYWTHRSSLYSSLQRHTLACWWCSCSWLLDVKYTPLLVSFAPSRLWKFGSGRPSNIWLNQLWFLVFAI